MDYEIEMSIILRAIHSNLLDFCSIDYWVLSTDWIIGYVIVESNPS